MGSASFLDQITPKLAVLVMMTILTLLYSVYKLSPRTRQEHDESFNQPILAQIIMRLPLSIRQWIITKGMAPGTTVIANIYPYALWMVYRVDTDKINAIEKYLPSHLKLMKHKIYASDMNEAYYLCYNIYMSSFNGFESLRLEINVIARNRANQGCWVVIDYYTDMMRADKMAPFVAPNAFKKYFDINLVENDHGSKREIAAGMYVEDQGIKHDLFDFKVTIDLKDKPLVCDEAWLTANEMMFFGSADTEKLAQHGWGVKAEFDRNEHNGYLEASVHKSVNNLFSDIRGELVTCFVIPNQQSYKLTVL